MRLRLLSMLFAMLLSSGAAAKHTFEGSKRSGAPISTLNGITTVCETSKALLRYDTNYLKGPSYRQALALTNTEEGYQACRREDVDGWELIEIVKRMPEIGGITRILGRARPVRSSEIPKYLFVEERRQ